MTKFEKKLKKYKILYILNDSHPLKYFLINHINHLNKKNLFEISVLFNNSKNETFNDLNIKIINFNIQRRPNLINDLYSLLNLIIHLSFNRYDLVHSISPKSGLLSAISTFLTFHKIRLHTFTGQVWANHKGFKLFVFKFIDTIIIKLNTECLIDSFAQKEFLIKNNIGNAYSLNVLNNGSICGVDLNRFNINKFSKKKLRDKLNIKINDFVILFLGRLKSDKGIFDLYKAFQKLNLFNAHLLIIGDDEENIIEQLNLNNKESLSLNIHVFPVTKTPEKYIAISDILCLPSYREGFGNVIIESAAMKVPSVVSDIYGLKDSIINNETGLFFELGNTEMLCAKLKYLYDNKKTLNYLGLNAFEYVNKKFDSNDISQSLYEFYIKLLK